MSQHSTDSLVISVLKNTSTTSPQSLRCPKLFRQPRLLSWECSIPSRAAQIW